MRLTSWQKLIALAGAATLHQQIKQLLIRRYWQRKTDWKLDFHGVSAAFYANDFYSNIWFYGPQNVEKAYEPLLTTLIIDFAKKSRFFADIGANLGYFSVVAGKSNPSLKVVAIELDETLVPIITKNIDLNELSNVELKSGAVGDGVTVVSYQPHAYSFLCAAAGEDIAMPRIDLQAQSFELDSFFRSRGSLPDLVKMDVDGAELVALESADEMLANPELSMFVEVQTVGTPESAETASNVGRLLSGRGFSFYTISESKSGQPVKLEQIDDLDNLPASPTTAMILVTRRPLSFFGY